MGTYTNIIYQVVFSTKYRRRVMIPEGREKLYNYIAGIILNNKCVVYKIGGVSDHLHILFSLHPTVALSALVKDIKIASSVYIKTERLFPGFTSWQIGYGAFTYSMERKEQLIRYIQNQRVHHGEISFEQELRCLLEAEGVHYEERYLFEE